MAKDPDITSFSEAISPLPLDAAPGTLARYGRTTLPGGHAPVGVVRPKTVAEVQRLTVAASTHGVPLYPISRGKNWGYGDAAPAAPGCVLVELSQMNTIREIDAEMGFAIVEPGVTQGQLVEEVARRAPGFWVDCTGAGPEASIVGNALERGFGHTPYGDHVRSACGLEVVLADGTLLRTGTGQFEGAKAACLYPYGVGPILDGLFMQSNLGIVTAMTVWLCPKPEAFRFFYIKVQDESTLPRLIDALRGLRLQGILNSAVHIGNDLRVISGQRNYPHERTGGSRPLPDDVRLALRREAGLGAWSVSGSFTGTGPQVRAAAARLKKAMRGIGKVITLSDGQLHLLGRVARALPSPVGAGLKKLLDDLEPHVGLLQGKPTLQPLRGALWGLNRDGDALEDPVDAQAGLIWLAPVVPMRGADAVQVCNTAHGILARHGFDFLITFTLLNERSMVAVMNVSWDKTDAAQGERARECYEEVMQALIAAGYPPYRSSLLGMPLLWQHGGAAFWDSARKIKQALDPRGVIAPGRYVPREEERAR